ncbi:uncharacterized protein A4U43_C04F1310 [Asparagus officinalis]|uniref:Ubiquitin-like domain-containing protein n=1 Tax=Asparagus officinalis TaxID=4686 RepID=A0A5P1EXH2_ASPOF|nr:uncharacterized protein A4U43_C04F1310 [Asparagus officinalis]
MEGICQNRQGLIYMGKSLEDNHSLLACNIQNGSTLQMILCPVDKFDILICTMNGYLIKLEARSWYTIRDIKLIVEGMKDIDATKQRLFCDVTELEDSLMLSECRIFDRTILHLQVDINPQLKSIPILANDLQKVYLLMSRTNKDEPLNFGFEETREEKEEETSPSGGNDSSFLEDQQVVTNQPNDRFLPELRYSAKKRRAPTVRVANILSDETCFYAHRACVQRWCNEKGDIMCEICHEPYKPDYTAPPRPNPDETTIDISGGWTIIGTPLDLCDPRILAMAAEQRHFLEAEYHEYAATNATGTTFCRSAALIARIEAMEGISQNRQGLVYMGKSVEDNHSLLACNIQNGSTLQMILCPVDKFDILICTMNGHLIKLEARSWYTIRDIKLIVEGMKDIDATKQRLFCDVTELEGSVTLSECRIFDRTILHLHVEI